jgi:molecular chaperone GrpE
MGNEPNDEKQIVEQVDSQSQISVASQSDANQSDVEISEKEILTNQIKEMTETIRDLKDKNLRAYADFENYKKRVNREKEDLRKYGNEELITQLLPVVDHLEMALQHSGVSEGDNQTIDAVKKGVEMALKDFIFRLKKYGLEEIAAQGQPFDPVYHHAMNQVVREDLPENTVVSQFRKGYALYEKVLRASLVSVSKKPEAIEQQPIKIEEE